MVYRVNPDKVAAEVENFSGPVLDYWKVCLAEIANNPYPRTGYYVERVIPIPPFPMRTYLYWITEEVRFSGESVFVFTAEFFPEYLPVYVVNEQEREVVIFYVRSGR